MAAPTNQELAILSKFRQRLTDLKLDQDTGTDMYLLKWLRAREMNLSQAEVLLRKSLKWRQENDVDSILTWQPPEFLVQNYRIDYVGFDPENSPVAIFPFGRWDIKKLVQMGHKMDYIRYVDQFFEKLLHNMKGKVTGEGVQVTQFIVIVDMNGLSMSTLACRGALEAIFENVMRYESNFPETVKACIIINASTVFTILFSMMKPLMSQRTFGKVKAFNSNAAKWQPVIFQIIPPDRLPLALGGTSTAPSCLDNNQQSSSTDSVGTTKMVTVGAGSILSVPLKVDEVKEGTVIQWFFQTEHHDIDYSLNLLTTQGGRDEEEVLVTGQRVQSKEGSWECTRPGTYIFKFDNSFSRLRSKVIKYRIDVLTTHEE